MSAMLDIMTNESKEFEGTYADILGEVTEYYAKEYGDNKTLESTDVWAIGKYTQTVETYAPFMNEGSDVTGLGNIGTALQDNIGLTATQYATSIVPLLATVQPTTQELAIIYYKRGLATATRGGTTAGQEVMSRFGKVSENMDDYISDEQIATGTVVANGPYTIQLLNPVRPGTVNVNIAGKVTAIDNREGKIFGGYMDPDASSINYDTGVLTVVLTDFAAAGLVAGDAINVVYTQLVFSNDVIAGFKYDIVPEAIQVQYYPLQITYDTVSDFVTKRQFGQAISEFANKDLIYQINKAISSNMIKKLRNAAIKNENVLGGALTWDTAAPAGTSLIEHRRTFTDVYDMSISAMEQISGLGGVSAVITGATGRRIYQALGITNKKSKPGSYVMGFHDGVVVIYAPSEVIPADEILVVYKGDFFETAAVYAPFLPVLSIKTQGRDHNVFQSSHGVATGAAMKVVNDGFVVRVRLI